MNKRSIQGQTALILILLAAAALIFLAITLNWGRIAQTKSMLSIAADQAASLLASDAASYGEMEKQTNLKDKNELSGLSGILMDIIMIVIAIIVLIITITTAGGAAGLWGVVFAVAAVVFSIVNLALQLTVVQPGMNALWNKLQKDQPIQQQFYEGGIGAALTGAVTDQVNITDYFDENTNGVWGITATNNTTQGNIAKDSIGRFAFFYTERLKMLNKNDISQVRFFYDQLEEFMNGESCAQNLLDNYGNAGVAINPSCIEPGVGNYCGPNPTSSSSDPACQGKVANVVTCAQNASENAANSNVLLNQACPKDCPNPSDPACQLEVSNDFSFQLNDPCTDSDPNGPTYNPYCDTCCQPMVVNGKSVRPFSCWPSGYPTLCGSTPNDPSCYCTASPNDPRCVPSQCTTSSNPYNPSYPYIYDPTYQEYVNGMSFLDQFGRDQQQVVPSPSVQPLTSMTVQGNFPNGIYPFFWLMTHYSPEVDNIDPTTTPVKADQAHWCVAGSTMVGGTVQTALTPTGFTDLTQLGQPSFQLPYTCNGPDCCVNYLPNSVTNNNALASSPPIVITVGSGPAVTITTPISPAAINVGGNLKITGNATEAAPGSITSITLDLRSSASVDNDISGGFTFTPGLVTAPTSVSFNNGTGTPIPSCSTAIPPTPIVTDTYALTATATDANGNTGTSVPVSVTINNPGASTCAGSNCGTDSCGNPCGSCTSPQICCPAGQTCAAAITTPGTCGTVGSVIPPNANTGISKSVVSNIKGSVGAPGGNSGAAATTVVPPPSVTMTATDNGSNILTGATIPAGDSLVLTAIVTGGSANTQVLFYNGAILLGSGTETGSTSSTATYNYALNNTLAGTYNLIAEVVASGNATGSSNGVIDMVGAGFATTFGYNGNGPWLEADNQMCSLDWPYNAASTYFPDGSCEWTGTEITDSNKPSSKPSVNPAISTLDDLDDVMHTLSDFAKFSQSFLNKDFGTINSTFDTWYPQAAGWIAPACAVSSCSGSGNSSSFEGNADDFDKACNNSSDAVACNEGGDGRLLNIYDPADYPGVPGVANSTNAGVDKLNDWNEKITAWLTKPNAKSGAWCLPPTTTGSPTEDNYINNNSNEATSPATWGDLPHVISCLNFNAGPNQAVSVPNAANFQTCLSALTSGTCPVTIPDTCASPSLIGIIPASVIPWLATDAHRCEVFYVDPANGKQSFANWVSSNINFGPVYNYQNCLNLLTNACPAKLTGTVCDPSVLGRSLLSPVTRPKPVFSGKASCALAPGSYAQWVSDSLTLATDEAPKFALRSAFLTDIYTRAHTLQNITAQGDIALHNFLKSCGGCSGDTTTNTCSAGGTCADGSACGSPLGKCEDGGPAAQLIYESTQPNPARVLPNSVIYGWVDKTLANGKNLPGTLPGAGGYAHIVKVTAYSPGRDGNGATNLRGLRAKLPYIHAWSTFFEQKYALANRDGNVYVSVKRWDQDHTNCDDGSTCVSGVCQGDKSSCGTVFPNGHLLWQIMTHNPKAAVPFRGSPLSACLSPYPGVLINVPFSSTSGLGFGLEAQTVQGLQFSANQLPASQQDEISLSNAFMLNDTGDGKGTIDLNAKTNGGDGAQYLTCLSAVKALLSSGVESHSCARYVASYNPPKPGSPVGTGSCSDPSGNGDHDYCIKFVDCNKYDDGSPPDSPP